MKFKGKTAYFSHSKSLYGTKEEKFILCELERILKGIVICPNRDIGNFKGHEYYDEIASKLDLVFVWSESNHSELTRGCFKEVEKALHKLPCILIELSGDSINFRDIITIDKYEEENNFEYGSVESVAIETFSL
jgi:hypothetical protein